jgi:hypothetical protein
MLFGQLVATISVASNLFFLALAEAVDSPARVWLSVPVALAFSRTSSWLLVTPLQHAHIRPGRCTGLSRPWPVIARLRTALWTKAHRMMAGQSTDIPPFRYASHRAIS